MYKPVFHPFLDPARERSVLSFVFLPISKSNYWFFLFLFLMEKTNPVLILTKCVLHMCEASRFCSRPFLKGVVCCSLGVRHPPPLVVPMSVGPAPVALHLPVMTSASRDGWVAGWPLHSGPSSGPLQTPGRRRREALRPARWRRGCGGLPSSSISPLGSARRRVWALGPFLSIPTTFCLFLSLPPFVCD